MLVMRISAAGDDHDGGRTKLMWAVSHKVRSESRPRRKVTEEASRQLKAIGVPICAPDLYG